MDYGVKNQFSGWLGEYLLVVTNSLPLKMAHLVRWFTELKDGGSFHGYVNVYQGVTIN